MTLGGTLYYTKTGSQYLTTVEADYSPVAITFNTCRNYTVLSKPIAYDGSPMTVSLYIDLRNIAHVFGPNSTLYNSAKNNLSCSVPNSGTSSSQPYICVDYPDVGGTITGGSPTVQRYKLTNSAQSGSTSQLIGFYFDSSGEPIGGYNRAYLVGVTNQTSLLSTPSGFKKTKSSGGKLYFTDYSGGDIDIELGSGTTVTNKASTQGNFTVEDFPMPAVGAAAQSITSVKDTNGNASSVTYTVRRID